MGLTYCCSGSFRKWKNHYIGLSQNPEKAGLCGGVLIMIRFPTEIASSLGTGIGQVSYIGFSSNIIEG